MEYGGKDYFVWSGRTYGTDAFSSQSLYIAQMSNPWTLSGSRTRISSPTYAWETHGHPVNEGPEVLRHGDDLFLTYSASAFETPYYAVGALKLTGNDPLSAGSWTKLSQPLFQQGNGVEGTGHASFVESPDGTEDWIVYHARTAPTAPRDVRIQRFTWAADGTPVFGSPTPTGQATAAPSGSPLVTFVPNESFERGGAGWLDDFHVVGDAGAVDNDGQHFTPVAGADGTKVGYLSVGGGSAAETGNEQHVGPIHAGRYSLSLDLAISDDQAAAARAHPGTFRLELEGIGRFPGGSANEAEQTTLGELDIDSDALAVSSFTTFTLRADVPEGELVGDWLRVALGATGDGGLADAQPWSVKMDRLMLDFSAPDDSAGVPEPGTAAAAVLVAGGALLRRRRRR
jgi:hypothetical protein